MNVLAYIVVSQKKNMHRPHIFFFFLSLPRSLLYQTFVSMWKLAAKLCMLDLKYQTDLLIISEELPLTSFFISRTKFQLTLLLYVTLTRPVIVRFLAEIDNLCRTAANLALFWCTGLDTRASLWPLVPWWSGGRNSSVTNLN